MKSLSVTTQMQAIEQYFPVVLFIMLQKVILTFESANEIPTVTIQIKAIRAVLSCGTVYYVAESDSNFRVCE